MRSRRRAYLDGPFGQMHYQRLGEGAPILLLHQAPMTSGQFDNVYAPLAARGFDVIGLDMPGFGLSDPTPHTPAIKDFAQAVPALLDGLGIPVIDILGHHTGGLVAADAAIRWPERFRSLIINGPLTITDEERETYMAGWHQTELAFKALPGGEHLVWLFKYREMRAAGSVDLSRITQYVANTLIGRGLFWYGHHAAYEYRLADALPRITVPTLILTNTGDTIYEQALRAQRIRPDFAYCALEGGGIDIVDQQPEAWAAAVADYVVSVAERR